jgi:DNA-binding NtrC family response regulator
VDSSTVSENDSASRVEQTKAVQVLALTIAFSAHEPSRIGEVTLFPPTSARERRAIGRGEQRPGDPGIRALFIRQRPGQVEPTGVLTSPKLSRVQLLVRAEGSEYLEIENVGRATLVHRGAPTQQARVRPGEALQLGGQLLLLCVQRPLILSAGSGRYPDAAFGESDAHGIVGESPLIWSTRQQLAVIGPHPGHVLVRGASGTGKELAAQAIHALSSRSARALIARNAATFPESLIDAELFGTARDYPNKGMPERPGIIGQAHESTLFLDEIGELPHPLQAHLLRVLDAGEFQRLGESLPRSSDFRLIAATNRAEGGLRPELLARFTFHLDLPTLNARKEDIPLLARFLIERASAPNRQTGQRLSESPTSKSPRLSLELCKQLVEHTYTLNVRELDALLWRSSLESTDGLLKPLSAARLFALQSAAGDVEHSIGDPQHSPADPAMALATDPELGPQHNELSAARIKQELDRHNGSLEATWRALGLKNRFILMRLIDKYDIGVTRRSRRRSGR